MSDVRSLARRLRAAAAPEEAEPALDHAERLLAALPASDHRVAFARGAILDARVALRPENRDLLRERLARVADQLDRLAGHR
jgi:hypothetical protein